MEAGTLRTLSRHCVGVLWPGATDDRLRLARVHSCGILLAGDGSRHQFPRAVPARSPRKHSRRHCAKTLAIGNLTVFDAPAALQFPLHMQKVLQLDSRDNVLIALADLK